MGIIELVTTILIVCKLMDKSPMSSWSWWKIFMPEMIAISVYIVIAIAIYFILFGVKNTQHEES